MEALFTSTIKREVLPTRLKVNVMVRLVSHGIAHCPPKADVKLKEAKQE
jgi:hypothetical protein